MAPRAKGVVVTISGQDRTEAAFAAVEARVRQLEAQSQTFASRGANVGKVLGEGMEHAVPQVAAASAAIRTFEGALPIRALERLATLIPGVGVGLQNLFIPIAVVDGARLLVDGVEKVATYLRSAHLAAEALRKSYRDIHTEAQLANDELRVTNDRLEDEIAKLEHKPQNNLKLALDESRVAADKLAESLEKDAKRSADLLKENAVGRFKSLLTGSDATTDVAGTVNYYRAHIADAASDASDAAHAGDPKALAAANQRLADAQNAYAKYLHEEIAKRTGTVTLGDPSKQGQYGYTGLTTVPYSTIYGDQTADLNILRGERSAIGDSAEHQQLETQHTTLDTTKQGLESKKGLDAARQRADEARRQQAEADERFAAAQRAVADAATKASAAADKAATEAALNALESRHRALLVSDESYYAQREALQNQSIATQRDANLNERGNVVTQILGAQRSGVGFTGIAAENNRSRILELGAKLQDLDAKDAALTAQITKNVRERADAETDLARRRIADADTLAAGLEARRGGSTAARSRQSLDEYQRRRQELIAEFGSESAPAVQDLDRQQGADQAAITAKGADETLSLGDAGRNARRTGIKDAERRGLLSTQDAQQARIALDREEAGALQPVLAAYQALASAGDLGAAEKVAALQTRILELKDPVNEVAAEVRDQLGSAFERLFENLDHGKKALQDFGNALKSDVLKDVYTRFVQPGVQAGLGALIPNSRPGALPTPQSALGGLVPKALPSLATSLLGGEAKGGGGVKVEIINQTSQPAQVASASGESLDSQLTDKVVHIVLKNVAGGGALSGLFRG